ncbi:DUF374 domain-containing protein [bacterium]|nr:DUF374 domain-containing protein [bacterium]
MVRLINQKNLFILEGIARLFVNTQKHFTYIRRFNPPKTEPCVYAMWHENQFAAYGLPDINNVNILISNSMDGQIISTAAQSLGFKICRGSSNRKGSVSSTLHMIDKLKSGESVAIMVDGPRGPYHEVKPGVVMLAKETKVPIVPVHWYSTDITFRKFPSWDKMLSPVGPCRILNSFSDPIYVENKSDEQVLSEVKNALINLEKEAPERYKEARKAKLWKQKQ